MAFYWFFLTVAALGTALVAPALALGQDVQTAALALAVLFVLLWLRQFLARRNPRARRKNILIDGSNVVHWNGGDPDIGVLRSLVHALAANDYMPSVIFDANIGYKLSGLYMNDAALARQLNVSKKQVMVSPKGEPADGFLLQAARDMDASIVTNDRFRDWHDTFPELSRPGLLIHGGFRDGAPYLRHSTAQLD